MVFNQKKKQKKKKKEKKKQDQLQREKKFNLKYAVKKQMHGLFLRFKTCENRNILMWLKNKQIQKVSTFSLLTDNIQHECFFKPHLL